MENGGLDSVFLQDDFSRFSGLLSNEKTLNLDHRFCVKTAEIQGRGI